jgi:hypothetical protein
LLIAATDFQQRVGTLDEQATRLKRQNRVNPSPAVTMQLAQLQRQKEIIADDIIASLPRRLSNHAEYEMDFTFLS